MEVVIERQSNHHPLTSENVTLEGTMHRELGGGVLPLGDQKRVHSEATQSVKCVPRKHEDLSLIPKTHVAAVAHACISNTDKGTDR